MFISLVRSETLLQKKNMPVTTRIMTFLEVYMCFLSSNKNNTCLHHLHVLGCFQLHMFFFWEFPTTFSPPCAHHCQTFGASERSRLGASNSQPSGKGLKVVPATFPSHQVTKWSSEQSHRIQYNWD